MKDGLINCRCWFVQKRQLRAVDSRQPDLEGDGCSAVPASDTSESLFTKLIRMSFLRITISPGRIIIVTSLDNQPHLGAFMSLQAEPAFNTRASWLLCSCAHLKRSFTIFKGPLKESLWTKLHIEYCGFIRSFEANCHFFWLFSLNFFPAVFSMKTLKQLYLS